MCALQKLSGCVPTHNARCEPAVRANADTILQEDEWNRCEENPYKADEGRSPLYAHLRACQNKSGGGSKDGLLKPTLLNICVANRVTPAPAADRTMVLTAKADAAYVLRAPDSVFS